jgi:predicted CxxxxCH...CXXCH cytochrome family protein
MSNECGVCHRSIDRAYEPATHDAAWLAHHGDTVRGRAAGSANRCELCHAAANSCDACHRETPPADHTQHFRLRGHGTWAAIDRSRCSTCHHRRDFCQRCHESTPPLSHVAGFGGTQNRHCASCHFPASSSGCTTCHSGGAQHPSSTPMPAWHSPAMNCRQCHGAGVSLPHPDGGHSCTACHR